MRIAIIASARTRSTLLMHYIHARDRSLKLHYEYYTYALKEGFNNLREITNQLICQNDYIVKIMGHNLNPIGSNPADLKLREYDKIYLVERSDFFDQCCSLQVCVNTNIWHRRIRNTSLTEKYHEVQKSKLNLEIPTIISIVNDVANYLSIKKYLISNQLSFTTLSYEELEKYGKYQQVLANNNLAYSDIITNYSLKNKINELANKCFSFSNAEYDLDSFIAGVSDG